MSQTEILMRLGFVMLATIVLMSVYEYVKQEVFLPQGIRQSHVFTMVFSGIAAAVAAFFVLKKYDEMNYRLRCRINETAGKRSGRRISRRLRKQENHLKKQGGGLEVAKVSARLRYQSKKPQVLILWLFTSCF